MSATPEREARIFSTARKLPAEDRAFYLDDACAGDAPVRQRVEELLQANDAAGAFLPELASGAEGSAKGVAARESADTIRADPSPSEQPGDSIDRYKLLEKIGEGGFGVVYVAEQKEPVKRRVALKIIKLGMDTKQVVARFGAERQALALMDHPNIAKVLDAGTTSTGRPFFVMELVKGIKLTDYCDKNRLSTKERLNLFIQVCRAIQHAHQKGIIHRDIKPSNILVTLHDGVPVPKVIDFGIAKATQGDLTDQTVYTQYQQFIGTPAYMSPEQAEMSGLDIDTRSDIYSLGVLLYELLTGKTPFDAKELMASGIDAMRKTIREREPVRPSTRLATLQGEDLTTAASHRSSETSKLMHQLKGDLDWIVMKALEKDRTRRYETANGLVTDIQRHLKNEPVVARPPSNLYRFQKMVGRNKLAFAAAGAVVAALVLGLGFSSWQAIRATRSERKEQSARAAAERSRVVAEQAQVGESSQRALADENARKATELLYAADMRLAQQAWDEGNLSRMAGLLEAHRPKPGAADDRGFEYFCLQNFAKGEQEQVLHGHTNEALGIAISPDGKWLASRGETDLRLWDLAARAQVAVLSFPKTPPYSRGNVGFSYDSQYLALGTDTGLQIFNIPTRQTRALSTIAVGDAVFSPVTNLIAFVNHTNISYVHVWDYTANKEVSSSFIGGLLCWSPDGTHLVTGKQWRGVYLYDTATAINRHSDGLNAYIYAAVVSPDGRLLAGTDFRMVHLLETPGLTEIGTLASNDIGSLAFSPDGKLLALGSGNGAIQIWDVARQRLVRQLRGHRRSVTGLAFTPDGRTLASAAEDRDVMLWNPLRPTGETQIPGGSLAGPPQFSPNGELLGLATNSSRLSLFDSVSLQEKASFNIAYEVPGGQNAYVVSISPDSRQLLVLPNWRHPELQVWTIGASSNRATIHLDAREGQIIGVKLSPDGTVLSCAMFRYGQPIVSHLFRAATGELLLSCSGVGSGYFQDGRTFAYSIGSRIQFFDLPTRQKTRSFECDLPVSALSVSPDGKTLGASLGDNSILLWDLESGARVGVLSGLQSWVGSLAFSPDGRTLASGSSDGTVRLWNLATQRELASFNQGTDVRYLVFSPDNQMLIAEESDAYHVWRAPRSDAAVTPGAPQVSLADLPTNSIWRVPDGPQPLPPRMAGAAPALKVGDPAPKLQTGPWIQGEPVAEFSPGKAYLVVFWDTGCDPSLVSLSHLNAIHNRYKDKGLIVIGQDCWEGDDLGVAPFIKKMGEKMTYRVVLDDKKASDEGKMVETWMAAAGRSDVPTAFLVDTNGRIAWIGPTMRLGDQRIEDVLSGNYDPQKAAADYVRQEKFDFLSEQASRLATEGNLPEAEAKYVEALELNRKALGPEHPDTLLATTNLANFRHNQARRLVQEGNAERAKGDVDGAMANYTKAIELDPKYPWAYHDRGCLRYDSRAFAEALLDFRRPVELDSPSDLSDYARFRIWLVRARLGEAEAATAELQTYLAVRSTGKPDDWPSKIGRFLAGRLAEADFLAAARNVDARMEAGQLCEAYFYAASKHLVAGDKAKAKDYFEKSIATDKNGYTEHASAVADLKFLRAEKR
jgi:serine/threonine protein kinase/WD40 repeat protein/tetratricopeptide (TPR) repeat protein